MTEIVKNNNSMTFDLLETGNSGTNPTEDKGVFNALFGVIDTQSNAETRNADINGDGSGYNEMDILGIVNMLEASNLNLPDEILEDIKIGLKNLFERIDIEGNSLANVNSEQLNSVSNGNFVHIMKFLEELEGLISLKNNSQEIAQELDLILDKIRTKLNEQVKVSIEKNISKQHNGKNDPKTVSQDKNNNTSNSEQGIYNKPEPKVNIKNAIEVGKSALRGSDFGASKKPIVKVKKHKKVPAKPDSLNISSSLEKKADLSVGSVRKVPESKIDTVTQTSANTTFAKDLNLESNLSRQPITLTNKVDIASNFETSNNEKPAQFKQENNDKLIQTLNMLSKSWGNSLIEKIDKSILDGVEQLEISLTPKSLGRLNVTINIQDAIAKINIIAESATAAALLGDAESKLSQMMEASGLKLASLQTQANQFGGNHKGKDRAQKLASAVKKASIENSTKPIEKIDKVDNVSEGLNLIA